MDATGAEKLRRRIEGHQHWVTAPAVREGRQPAADPEAAELEEILDGVRLYGREVAHERVDGRIVPVSRRMAKRLVDGAWETSFVVDEADDSGGSVSSGRA
jgi:hypothetical protein